MDPNIHLQAETQVAAKGTCTAGAVGCSLNVPTEPYHPAYFLINGRSMPDDMDPNYSPQYPHQPYNGNPHMHPGEMVLLRIIGQGRWQHPFHEHANHVRILARDGNLILTPNGDGLAGPALFTTTTTPGMAMDGIFYYTGRGLNWDMYGHNPKSGDAIATLPCTPDANGYNTGDPSAINYYEWCQDHNKPLQKAPFGDVAASGPATLPDPNILSTAPGTAEAPILDRMRPRALRAPPALRRLREPSRIRRAVRLASRSCGTRTTSARSPRTISFPGGMMMMMLVDSREFVIDESN